MSPKKGGPQRVTAKAKLPFASPFPKTKRDTHTHTHQWQKQTRHRRKAKQKLQTTGGMAPPGVTQGACWGTNVLRAHTAWPGPHPASALRQPSCHLDPARETKMDSNDGQGAQTYPRHGPRRAASSPVTSCRLLSSRGLASNPPQGPMAPASLALQGARAALSGSPWRSPWRDFGSEKLWMREGQGPSPVPRGLRAARVPGCGN